MNINLSNFNKNIYSQFREDGIIEEILSKLQDNCNLECCEFGAWDGIHLSNTYNLILNKNYNALLIEPNKKKFKDLCKNIPQERAKKVNIFVEFEGNNSLDSLLEIYKFKKNFDFLSIDVDGNDYHIFNSIKKYQPKIVCIEYNPTIPNDVIFVQEKNEKINHGSSALALINLAKIKNYSPIAATKGNIFFCHNDFKSKVVGEKNYSIDELIDDSEIKNYIFSGMDGTIFTSRDLHLPWHGIIIKKIKLIPNHFNEFPANFNFLKRIAFIFYSYFKNPKNYRNKPQKYLKKLKDIFKIKI